MKKFANYVIKVIVGVKNEKGVLEDEVKKHLEENVSAEVKNWNFGNHKVHKVVVDFESISENKAEVIEARKASIFGESEANFVVTFLKDLKKLYIEREREGEHTFTYKIEDTVRNRVMVNRMNNTKALNIDKNNSKIVCKDIDMIDYLLEVFIKHHNVNQEEVEVL